MKDETLCQWTKVHSEVSVIVEISETIRSMRMIGNKQKVKMAIYFGN